MRLVDLLGHQIPPKGDWKGWLLLGGRGAGLTYGAMDYAHHWAAENAGQRIIIAAHDLGDARDICAEGESGLITRFSSFYKYNRSEGRATHPNGSQILFRSIRDDSVRRGKYDLLVVDSLKLCDPYCFEQALEHAARSVCNSVPMTDEEIKRVGRDFVRDYARRDGVEMTQAATFFNPHLPDTMIRLLAHKYLTPEGRANFAGLYAEGE